MSAPVWRLYARVEGRLSLCPIGPMQPIEVALGVMQKARERYEMHKANGAPREMSFFIEGTAE